MGNLIDRQIRINEAKIVSFATRQNWVRLNTMHTKRRLSARANKRMSEKMILPKECFDDIVHIPQIQEVVDTIKRSNYDIDDALFSLGINLLNRMRVSRENLMYLRKEYNLYEIVSLTQVNLPNESDILGLIYQMLQTEGEKNIKGSYYTPQKIVRNMVSDIVLKGSDKVLDPCCGSGVFLFNILNISPEQIYGVDIDPIAIMLARINYFLKFPQTTITPKIYEADYLEHPNLLSVRSDNFRKHIGENSFNYIITNPPWGGINIHKGEVFSCFLIKSYEHLSQNGQMRFLLPYSILNVKSHQDIRKYLLEKTDLRKIYLHPGSFSGVMTQYISIEVVKAKEISDVFTIYDNSKQCKINKKILTAENNFVISAVEDIDKQIIDIVQQKRKYDLSNSVWALGIVTGDNKEKLFDKPLLGCEPIYTGKEITPFRLKKPTKYIVYERANFQQVAKDEIYRAKEKLVYKFISNKLVFSIDKSQSLFLNSANILIPNIPNMSIYSVAAFLNSELYQYLYQKTFGEIKILKGSL
ncbi:MAG: N-6 DNA methylase, partial [Bacteroidales bacterium]|nr:N-6 DNA methylase [Bacteroidales bacterium]